MIKFHRHIFLMIAALAFSLTAQAQFINLHLKIEPELSATVKQNLDFGTQISNSGRTEIHLEDVNMGIFSIRAFHTQNVYLSMQFPEALVNNNADVEAKIPMQLQMAYNNTGKSTVNNATPLPTTGGFVSIHENANIQNKKEIWQEMFIYVYGAITVRNIPNGVYTGDIILSVDYD